MSSASVTLTIKPSLVSFSHVWRTNITRTVLGRETRSTLLTWPRLSIESDFTGKTTDQINWVKRNLIKYGASIWAIPCWWDYTTLTSQANSGQASLIVKSTGNRHFYTERDIILIDSEDWQTYEVGTINSGGGSITETSITLDSNLTSTWASGSFVIPLYDCRIDPISISRIFKDVEYFKIKAVEAYEEDMSFTYTLPSSGANTYESLDLFETYPMFPLNYSFDFPYELTQFYGIGYRYVQQDLANLTLKMSFICSNRSKVYELLDYFDSKQGMFQKFWLPTFSRDVIVNSSFGSSETVLSIDDIDYPEFYLTESVVGRHLYFRFPDGNTAQRKVVAAGSNPSSITVNSAIGTAVSENELAKLNISFLMLVRFIVDEIKINYSEGLYSARIDLDFNLLLEETEDVV